MTAPVYQALGTVVSGTGQVTPAWPTHQAGDIAFLIIEDSVLFGPVASTLATANGFQLLDVQNAGAGTGSTQLTIYWCRATSSSMASPVVDVPQVDHNIAQIITVRGAAATGNPVDVYAMSAKITASTTSTAPTVTTSGADRLVMVVVSRDNDSALTSSFVGWTNASLTTLIERSDTGAIDGNGGGFGIAMGTKTTAGATNTTSVSVAAVVKSAAFTIAIAPYVPTLIGDVSSSFTQTGILKQRVTLSGDSNVTITASATLKVNAQLSGVSSVAYTPAGNLNTKAALSGSIAVLVTVAGTLAQADPTLEGHIETSFAVDATMSANAYLVGNVDSAFAAAGNIFTSDMPMIGDAVVTNTAAGNLKVLAKLSGSMNSAFDLHGVLSRKSSDTDGLVGGTLSTAITDATLRVKVLLSGASASTYTAAGISSVLAPLYGVTGHQVIVTGNLNVKVSLSGTTTSVTIAELSSIRTMQGVSNSAFTQSGNLNVKLVLSGATIGSATTSGVLRAIMPMQGQAAFAFTTGAILHVPSMRGNVTVTFALSADLSYNGSLLSEIGVAVKNSAKNTKVFYMMLANTTPVAVTIMYRRKENGISRQMENGKIRVIE